MGKAYLIIFYIIFVFGCAVSAKADSDDLTFEETLKLAFAHNPQMMEVREMTEAAKGSAITVRSWRNPEVELEVGGVKEDASGDRDPNLDTIEIRQPFEPFGAKHISRNIAANQVKIQEEATKSVWSSVYLQISDVYSRIILRTKSMELAQANLNSMRQFFSRVQLKFQSGQAFKNDLQRAKIELLQAENDYLFVQKDLKTDKARLNLLLGRAMETEFDIQEELKEEELTASFDELKALALSNRPDIKTAQLEFDTKRKQLIKEHLNRLPSYYLGFQRTDIDDEEDYAVLVGFEIPFWNLNRGEIRKARAERTSSQVRAEATQNEAVFDVYDHYLTAELHQQQLQIFKTSLEESNELLRLANLRYGEGKIDFLNYLDQVKTVVKAKSGYYNSLFSLSRSISALEAAVYASLRQEGYFNESF